MLYELDCVWCQWRILRDKTLFWKQLCWLPGWNAGNNNPDIFSRFRCFISATSAFRKPKHCCSVGELIIIFVRSWNLSCKESVFSMLVSDFSFVACYKFLKRVIECYPGDCGWRGVLVGLGVQSYYVDSWVLKRRSMCLMFVNLIFWAELLIICSSAPGDQLYFLNLFIYFLIFSLRR